MWPARPRAASLARLRSEADDIGCGACFVIVVLSPPLPSPLSDRASPSAQTGADAALIQKARAIHDRVITLDTHDDINPGELHAPEELHAAARHAGQPAEDDRRRPRRRVLHRLRRPGTADAGGLRQRLQAGGRQVRRGASPDQGDRARADRAGADRGRRAADREVGQEGRADRHRERVFARHRHQARQGVLRSRRPLHVARAQRPQPVRRLEHRRARRQVAAQRPQRARQAGDRRDEQVGDHGRSLASVEGGQHAGAGALEGAGDRVALGGARARRSQPQHGRRAAARR